MLSSALYGRFASRGDADFADKLLSAMRHEFGGHVELATEMKLRADAGKAMRPPQSDALVLFGASGDLAHKKIFPALYAMFRRGRAQCSGRRRCEIWLVPRRFQGSCPDAIAFGRHLIGKTQNVSRT